MHCIPAKVSIKIHMLFQQHDRDTLARQQQGKHSPSRTGAHNAACCLFCLLFLFCHSTAPFLTDRSINNRQKIYRGLRPSSTISTTPLAICSCVYCKASGSRRSCRRRTKLATPPTKVCAASNASV